MLMVWWPKRTSCRLPYIIGSRRNVGQTLSVTVGVTMKNSLPSESSENTVLDEIQYGESNGGNRFSIGRSMTKLCIKN